MHFRRPDRVPLQYYYTPVGYYEHGEKLNELYRAYPGDFEPYRHVDIPVPTSFDADGRYHEFRRDAWGVEWEYRIFGIAGIPHDRPLKTAADLLEYKLPPPFGAVRRQEEYYTFGYVGSLYEQLLALYGDENVLCDMAENGYEINDLEDRLAAWGRENVLTAVKSGADGVTFGDDYGTQRGMVMSPALWRSFIKPRMKYMIEPAVKNGLDVHFHSCGQIMPILEDLREIGVTSIWPQIPAYDMDTLARVSRDLGLAVAIHTDRAQTMTYGTPQQVRDLVKREYDTFRVADGGAWFYVEADNGFPFENIEALVTAIGEWR